MYDDYSRLNYLISRYCNGAYTDKEIIELSKCMKQFWSQMDKEENQ